MTGFRAPFEPPRPPSRVPAATPAPEDRALIAGGFRGFMRRPQPQRAGLMVQVFGENGEDADTISLFHQSRYVEADARVAIYALKDGVGRPLRKAGREEPDVVFRGRIQRPRASLAGQTAQFLAANGPDADAAMMLGATRWLDAMVYVQVVPDAAPPPTAIDLHADLDRAAQALSMVERRHLQQAQKGAREANRLLTAAGFFRDEKVWAVLDRDRPWLPWLAQQPCAWPAEPPCPGAPVSICALPHTRSTWGHVPLCGEHAACWQSGRLPEGQRLDVLQSSLNIAWMTLLTRWSRQALMAQMGCPAGFLPAPAALQQWALSAGLAQHLPPAFLALASEGLS